MKLELINALCCCLDFVNNAAGEGIELEGLDAAELYWQVLNAVEIKPDDFDDHRTLAVKLRSVLEATQ